MVQCTTRSFQTYPRHKPFWKHLTDFHADKANFQKDLTDARKFLDYRVFRKFSQSRNTSEGPDNIHMQTFLDLAWLLSDELAYSENQTVGP